MSTTAAPELADLLQHSSWVRRLAGILVRDDARADDLAQQTWVSVLRSPPDPGLPVRPWLGQVVRNLARMGFRGERRRRDREEATLLGADPSAPGDSPEQLVARVQAQRTLAELVVALDEPYRTTVLLRYYEGHSAAEIAARLHVPPGTVRWRLKKALEELRTALDRRHGNDRQAWRLALTPFAVYPTRSVETSVPTVTKGATIMSPLIPAAFFLTSAVAGLVATKPHPTAPSRPVANVAPLVPARAPARLDKQQRTVMLENIKKAQHKTVAARNPALPQGVTAAVPELNKEYIRAQLQTLLPMIKECYETALRTSHFDGQLVVEFTIAAAKDVGGLVTDSWIDAAHSTITDVAMRECVQETMYAAQFPAPSDGGEMHVSYPFVFREE